MEGGERKVRRENCDILGGPGDLLSVGIELRGGRPRRTLGR